MEVNEHFERLSSTYPYLGLGVQDDFCIQLYLFDFRFLIQNMLPEHRVELFDFHFAGRGLFILGRCIKMSRPSAGNQPDFISCFTGH
uniref:Uncharacterized protein n=1 Tax=Candidatus Kentrum sp. FM TaxID=2126340 RepID=A0A450T8U6_9GAMM|nr:MAG: hypothetical protein BECKFM1743A_GA0114220_103244 [Candidatus Kentron sp. FM]VFK09476.1 MAG: hypothetical protein BECKFM1743B_GA0114221_101065 [Candidatus Kentron sp. FM]